MITYKQPFLHTVSEVEKKMFTKLNKPTVVHKP